MTKKENIVYNRERKNTEFWMDLDGKEHKFKGDLSQEYISIHAEIARTLYPDVNDPETVLMNLGWIMIGSSVYNCPIIHKKPTQAQLNKLYELKLYYKLCFLHNNSYPNYDKYKALID